MWHLAAVRIISCFKKGKDIHTWYSQRKDLHLKYLIYQWKKWHIKEWGQWTMLLNIPIMLMLIGVAILMMLIGVTYILSTSITCTVIILI